MLCTYKAAKQPNNRRHQQLIIIKDLSSSLPRSHIKRATTKEEEGGYNNTRSPQPSLGRRRRLLLLCVCVWFKKVTHLPTHRWPPCLPPHLKRKKERSISFPTNGKEETHKPSSFSAASEKVAMPTCLPFPFHCLESSPPSLLRPMGTVLLTQAESNATKQWEKEKRRRRKEETH